MINKSCNTDLKSLSTLDLIPGSIANSSQCPTTSPLDCATQSGAVTGIDDCIRRAQEHLLSLQAPDGSWKGHDTLGPVDTARTLIFESYLGILKDRDTLEGVRWLQGQQRADGSFLPYPFADEGDFNTTCYAYAGMYVAGVPQSNTSLQKSLQIIEANGGFAKARFDTQLFLVMAGLLAPEKLPSASLLHKLVPGSERLMIKSLGSWLVVGSNQIPGLIRGLKNKNKPPNRFPNPLYRLQNESVIAYLTHRQNPSGDWTGTGFMTMLSAACLYSLGVSLGDSQLQKALNYIDRLKIYSPEGMYALPWTSEIWDTACSVNGLLDSGIASNHLSLQQAALYLLKEQGRLLVPRDWQNPKSGTPRSGGWGYGEGNPLATDTDDTAAVLTALKEITNESLAEGYQEAMEKGIAWELGMQNHDGGWGTWTYGHATKKPGPIKPCSLSRRISSSMILTDPSVEGLTGRVLSTLGKYGYSKANPVVQKAISFLKSQQDVNGVWWGRWFANYLMSTSYILCGLKAVKEDMDEPYVCQAKEWLKSKQNDDGGWGEDLSSYENVQLAGLGKSTPSITGLVVSALIDAEEGNSEVVRKGVHYLLSQQNSEGTWEDSLAIGVAFPSMKLYYHKEISPKYLPLQALGKYRKMISDDKELVGNL